MPSTASLAARLSSSKETISPSIAKYKTPTSIVCPSISTLSVNVSRYKRLSLHESRNLAIDNQTEEQEETSTTSRRASFHQLVNAHGDSADLTAYYAVSRRKHSLIQTDEDTGLSGFLEYHTIKGTWRQFLFQTTGFQLVVYRVHMMHQVTVLTTDIREATDISLLNDDSSKESRLIQLRINNNMIRLRAITHHAAMYWVRGLQSLQSGTLLQRMDSERLTFESEEDVFRQIDQLSHVREWIPPASDMSLLWLCLSFCGWNPQPSHLDASDPL